MVPRDNRAQPDVYRTLFYSDCSGVFEGGGCRAAAYAGAYRAAYRHGVRFSEVAGTSAGAMVAALIAAGAEPDFLLDALGKLDFRDFLRKPDRPFFSKRLGAWGASVAERLPGDVATIVTSALRGGLYSSEMISEWIEVRLHALLPQTRSPVRFVDLLLPLYVVASDLTTMKPRVWSRTETPTASVAHAVRASCTIPMFFQPVEEGSTLLVDGGLVSNLPVFVFSTGSAPDQFPDRRVLSFALEAEQSNERPQGPIKLLRQLISLAIDGSTDVQSRFQPRTAKISIPTGTVQATDFDRMDEALVHLLVENGDEAATTFIKQELLAANAGASKARSFFDEHQAFLRLTEQSAAARNAVIVSFPDTKWFWELFPTAFYWIQHGVQIHCFTAPANDSSADSAKEAQRRQTMTCMGIRIYEQVAVPFRGFILDSSTAEIGSALLFTENQNDNDPVAQFYDARTDITVLAALYDKVRPLLQSVAVPPPLVMEALPASDLITLLKTNVHQYRSPNVTIDIETVDVQRIQLISRYVRAFRFRQIGALIDAYERSNLELFQPARIRLPNDRFSIVTPPVLEVGGDQFIALEGNTRSYHCLTNGITTIKAAVVRGTSEALPGVPVPLRQVRISASRFRPGERIQGFNRDLFRDIERAVRPLGEFRNAAERAS